MPVQMQIQAMVFASQALDLYDVVDCKSVAAHIKKVQLLSSSSTYPLLLLLLHTHTHTHDRIFFIPSYLGLLPLKWMSRSSTRDMGMGGNAWLDQTSVASSLTLKDLSSTSPWRLVISSSSKGLPPLHPLPDQSDTSHPFPAT